MMLRGPAIFRELAPPNPNTALVGDSITSSAGMSSFYWINGLKGGPLTVTKNAGIGSETVGGCLARIDNSYTNSTPGLAGLSPLGWVFLRTGTNDVAVGTSIASLQSTYDSLIAKILTYATHCAVMAVPPYASSTLPREYNAYLASVCAANPNRLTYVDDCVELRAGDTQIGSYFSDGVHPNPRGTYTMGVRGAAHSRLSALLSGYSVSPLTTDAADVYPAKPQWVTNPVMAGTGGTLGTGFTGVMADSWAIARTGSVTGVCSKVAADASDPNQTPWQRVAPSGSGGSGIDITTTLAGRTISTTDPETCEVALEMRFNALNTLVVGDFYAEVKHSDAGLLCPRSYLLCFDAGVITHASAVLHSSIPRDNSSSHADAQFRLHCLSEQNLTPAGSFDFRSVSVRG